MAWTHPARFNETSPVRAADLNDLAVDHESLLGDVARVSMPYASPIWRDDLGGLYTDMAMWHLARYLWLRVYGLKVNWWLTVNGVQVVRRDWAGGGAYVTWTETIDLSATNPNLVLGKIYTVTFRHESATDDLGYVQLRAIYQRESV